MQEVGSYEKVDEILATLLASHMGWRPTEDNCKSATWSSKAGKHLYTKSNWQPSINLDQALLIVEFLNAKSFLVSMIQTTPGLFVVNVVSVKGAKKGASSYKGCSLPRTICKAALSILRSIKV